MRSGWLLILSLIFVTGCSTASKENVEPQPETSAGMDREAIRKVIREHLIPIRHCYEKELKVKKKLVGKLILEWDILDTGKVSRVVIKKAFDPIVDACIVDVIISTQFSPAPKGSIGRVSFPFEFSDK